MNRVLKLGPPEARAEHLHVVVEAHEAPLVGEAQVDALELRISGVADRVRGDEQHRHHRRRAEHPAELALGPGPRGEVAFRQPLALGALAMLAASSSSPPTSSRGLDVARSVEGRRWPGRSVSKSGAGWRRRGIADDVGRGAHHLAVAVTSPRPRLQRGLGDLRAGRRRRSERAAGPPPPRSELVVLAAIRPCRLPGQVGVVREGADPEVDPADGDLRGLAGLHAGVAGPPHVVPPRPRWPTRAEVRAGQTKV